MSCGNPYLHLPTPDTQHPPQVPRRGHVLIRITHILAQTDIFQGIVGRPARSGVRPTCTPIHTPHHPYERSGRERRNSDRRATLFSAGQRPPLRMSTLRRLSPLCLGPARVHGIQSPGVHHCKHPFFRHMPPLHYPYPHPSNPTRLDHAPTLLIYHPSIYPHARRHHVHPISAHHHPIPGAGSFPTQQKKSNAERKTRPRPNS